MRARRQRRLVLWRPCGQHRRSVGVVIVTMCTVVVNKAGFAQLVAALGAVGRVARVPIDEVRLVPLWSGFFHLLLELREVWRDLTASAPDAFRERLHCGPLHVRGRVL